MKKPECEKAIRHLCTEWGRLNNIRPGSTEQPSYSHFKSWAQSNGYGNYFQFRSTMGPDYDAEQWFDEEFKQTWRN